MKLRPARPLSSSSRKRPKKGFALIATLTLMMLLAMLAVAVMATAASQNRIALQTMLQAEARQQALVGLDAAIGELQVELGPDQRVTASSGILSEHDSARAQHLLGVWDSWDGPIYGRSASGRGARITNTYTKGRADMFRRWLISSRDRNATRTMNAAEQLSTRDPGQRICMVGEGTLGKSLSAQHYVYADLLKMPATGKNEACFAWWIGGENQKAKVSVQSPKETDDVYENLRRTWDTPAPRFVDNRDLDFLPREIEEPARLVTLASLPLVGASSLSAGMPYFFDVTTSSYSLPVNVSMGGLKQDLCLLLNKPTLKDTEFASRSNQDCPLAEHQDLPRGTESDMPIGSWQNLHAYYNCWPDGSAKESRNITARLIGNLDQAYTRISGSIVDNNNLRYIDNPDEHKVGPDNSSYFDTRARMDEGSDSAGYARTPVMLAFMTNLGLVTEPREDGNFALRMCFAPMVLWWNPYNVPMKIRGQQLWSKSSPAHTTWLQVYSPTKNGDDNSWDWNNYAMREITQKEIDDVRNKHAQGGDKYDLPPGFGRDHGEFFQKSLKDATADIEFQPGEVLFFSPGQARSLDSYDLRFKNPWVLGYNPGSVAGTMANFYSRKPLKDLQEGKWYVEMRLGHGVDVTQKLGANGGRAGGVLTNGYWLTPRHAECITVMNGFHGASENVVEGAEVPTDPNDASGSIPQPSKQTTSKLSMGKWGMSPQRFLLGWYDPAGGKEKSDTPFVDRNSGTWLADGSQSDPTVPYYIASIGVVAKSANPSVDKIVRPGDYRGKIWQHSSPAFWGGALTTPDNQMRKYHPYQLAVLEVSSGMTSSPMDNIGNNGYLGITSEGEQVSFASVMELPVHPPFSLAGFSGMRLQPGWYKHPEPGDFVAEAMQRRMQYQSGVPGVGLGNAFADPCLPADDVYTYFQTTNEESKMPVNARLFGDFFDHGLLINDAMWDRWFCSSVSDMPTKAGKRTAQDVLTQFIKGKEELPVSRYKRVSTPYDDDQIIRRLMQGDGWKYIAQYLMIDGGFNVNSVSVEAWAAVLQGLAKRKLVAGKDGGLVLVEPSKSDNQVLFSRFMLSTTDKSVDGLGGYSMMQGSTNFRETDMASAWGEVRMLESESIRKLAEEMVKQVRKRGPFLSMSDFVNRRLQEGEHGLKGALQAAIDATDINRDFNDVQVPEAKGEMFKNPQAGMGSLHTAAPGYLIQSDVLASLGNILTVRDDTFTVRSYGCVRNPNKAILAQAWCEAVVQRTMNYVDPTDKPQDSEYKPDGSKGKNLSETNKVLGRQFRIVSFKWLDNWDI